MALDNLPGLAKEYYKEALAGTLPALDGIIGGPAADDAAASGNPVLVGGKYETTLNTVENGDATFLKTDENGRLLVRLNRYTAAATFTPAAASHTAGDANGAAGTFALGAPSASSVIITSASLEIDGATAEATAWRLYLYNVTPPSALADDAVWDLPSGDRASFLGYVDLGTAVDLGSTQWVETHGINKQIKLSGTGVFGYLVNLATSTPAAVAHIVTLHTI